MFESLTFNVAVFLIAAIVIAVAGTYLSRFADELADRTGLGEALIGTLVLAGATSLPDFAATLNAAVDGRAELAMSNVMGSIAVNLAFLGIGDIFYRKANLEHAAASAANLMQAILSIALLVIPLIAFALPTLTLWRIHAATPIILIAYISGLRLVQKSHTAPMWSPKRTPETVEDVPASKSGPEGLSATWIKFAALTAVTAAAGWMVMDAAESITDQTALSESVAGGLFTAISTSSPELVTTIAAIRQGALTLAVSNIVGTNCFNMLVIAAADLGYREGSIYQDISTVQVIWGLAAILMTAILLLGMVRRETYGIGKIGFESFLVLSVYAATVLLAVTAE